jgi:hypothetical protein
LNRFVERHRVVQDEDARQDRGRPGQAARIPGAHRRPHRLVEALADAGEAAEKARVEAGCRERPAQPRDDPIVH